MALKAASVNVSKKDRERTASYAVGGRDAPNKMLREIPAEPASAGRTGPSQAKAPRALRARGGGKTTGFSLALPAVGGHCAPIRKGR
jgi:hypothetical protein